MDADHPKRTTQGYHIVMSVVLLPLWILSGAFFPIEPTHPVMAWFGRLNPMTYAVSTLRAGLTGVGHGPRDLAILFGIAAVALLAAAWTARRGGT